MRGLLIAMFVMAMAPSAQACPRGTVCVSNQTRIAGAAEIARPRSMLQVATARIRLADAPFPAAALTTSLKRHVAPRRAEIEMPWIWLTLRQGVYARLPTYERVARRPENKFSLVLSPVVVSSPQDTVPGVGIEGGF